ncbi:hypothetical protein V6N13_064121 [Hibiscus sabdariffa]|uniref:Uncharacterized protein n=1 Tax=Hibiscus sabdariffa TaxID=183260 RepID=A0ABR2R258_9ROSI
MASEGVLLYRGDEHISSHIDDGQTYAVAEDLSPLQANDFEFDTEYYSWYLENGKPFLVSVEVGNKWREDPRCSKHRKLTSEFGQSFEEPINDPYDEPNFDRSRVWPSSWDSVEEQPSFGNVWNSVEEQPPMYGGAHLRNLLTLMMEGTYHKWIIRVLPAHRIILNKCMVHHLQCKWMINGLTMSKLQINHEE